MSGLRIDQINLVVPDVAAASRFLRSLGVDLPESGGEWEAWEAHHVNAPTSATGCDVDVDSPAFAGFWGGLPERFSGAVVNLRTKDRPSVDDVHARAVELGATTIRAPYDAFWGARYAVVAVPGPLMVGLMSPADDSHRSTPPTIADFA